MVVASPTTTNLRSQSTPKRPPLLPSDRDFNNNNNNVAVSRRSKSRQVQSRYMSTSSSSSTSASSSSTLSNSSYFSPSSRRRCPSPVPTASIPSTPVVNTASIKRSQSVERRVPVTPRVRGERINGEMSAAAKLLMSSSRSLSASFQGGTSAGVMNSATKAAKSTVSASPAACVRRGTAERKISSSKMTQTTDGENSRVIDQKQLPWPGRSRPPVSSLSRSVDLGGFEGKKLVNGSGIRVGRALHDSLEDGECKTSTSKDEVLKVVDNESCLNGSNLGSESIVSDRESTSSEGNSVSQDDSSSNASVGRSNDGGRSVVVPVKLWQEVASSRSKRDVELGGSPVGRSNLLKGTALPKLVAPKRLVMDSLVPSPRGAVSNRGLLSPHHRSLRPSSPRQTPASPAEVGSSLRPASPAKVDSSMRPDSQSKVGSSLRPAFPSKMGSSSRPSSPAKVGSLRPASPARVGSLRPSSPAKVGSSAILPASRYDVGSSLRPASPSIMGASLRSASPSRVGGSLRSASPNRVGATPRPASPSRVGASLRPASPSRVGASLRPASPNKLGASEKVFPSGVGRMASPSRVRNAIAGTGVNSAADMPSVLCFGADVRRGRVGDTRLGDAHLLRILHNRHLQWRFVNARAEASLSNQKLNSERSLFNAWRATLDLHDAVSSKRTELQWLKQRLKLMSILKGQMLYLEEWALMIKDHCSSLSGAIESIKASTIRLPLVSGAKADIRDVKDAICSAVDVMRSMASSICSLSEKVEEVNSLVAEVASITLKEQSFLNECKGIVSMLAAMQVKDCSLRAHLLQLKCAPSILAIEA